ncbi:hypothetical protein BJ508DRAFT_381314 [Ascobolus immersus RN42]|uniref:Uncharacterized protein n=1 Tax=Ascobolus immersus RN42 TaxID=1160509 RepID=A0A3N4HJX4_ASCIM|nr:hypothetical protein BJ508DRAFT_381314 [Ascobolus immersus RN42]
MSAFEKRQDPKAPYIVKSTSTLPDGKTLVFNIINGPKASTPTVATVTSLITQPPAPAATVTSLIAPPPAATVTVIAPPSPPSPPPPPKDDPPAITKTITTPGPNQNLASTPKSAPPEPIPDSTSSSSRPKPTTEPTTTERPPAPNNAPPTRLTTIVNVNPIGTAFITSTISATPTTTPQSPAPPSPPAIEPKYVPAVTVPTVIVLLVIGFFLWRRRKRPESDPQGRDLLETRKRPWWSRWFGRADDMPVEIGGREIGQKERPILYELESDGSGISGSCIDTICGITDFIMGTGAFGEAEHWDLR